jgi:hypothetical protein
LFMGIRVPGQLEIPGVIEWFQTNVDSSYRLIYDSELYEENFDLKSHKVIYDDVKTFAVVSNPWARAKMIYIDMINAKKNLESLDIVNIFNLDSFEKFILNWPTSPAPGHWFSIDMPQLHWVQFQEENKIVKVDYLIRQEFIEEDMKPLQDYFFNNVKHKIRQVDIFNTIYDYKKDYTTESKKHIEKMFLLDIDTFKYSF